MNDPTTPRDLGEQPIRQLMKKHDLSAPDVVSQSTEQITHKMIARAIKGRRLNPHVQQKILRALNQASGTTYTIADLFTY